MKVNFTNYFFYKLIIETYLEGLGKINLCQSRYILNNKNAFLLTLVCNF